MSALPGWTEETQVASRTRTLQTEIEQGRQRSLSLVNMLS